jgi:hypothetical protein
LKKEVDTLKQEMVNMKKKERVSILKWLNGDSGPKPTETLRDWIVSIPITLEHLEKVFEIDLIQGIISCLKDAIQKMNSELPLCYFSQKSKTIYVYHISKSVVLTTQNQNPSPKWEKMENEELKTMIKILAHRFLNEYFQWKQENNELIESSEEWQEKDMLYMQKMFGQDTSETIRVSRIQEWLYQHIQKSLCEYEFDV